MSYREFEYCMDKLICSVGCRLTKKALGTYLDDGDETKSGQVFYKLGKHLRFDSALVTRT